MLRYGVIVLGAADAERAARFWCAALGYQVRRDGWGGWARVLVPPGATLDGPLDRAANAIAVQISVTPVQDHPRLHLDLHVASKQEQEAEAERLITLGATRVDWDRYPDDPDFIVLADTEGNRFCIVDLSHEA